MSTLLSPPAAGELRSDGENIEFSEAMMRHFHQTCLAHMGWVDPPAEMAAQ